MAEAHGNPTSSLRRCAGMCRVGQMKYIVPIIVGITFVLTVVSAEKKIPENAAKGWCFIAPDGGKKWHAKRSCRSLKKSTNVKYLKIEDAKKLGENKKWVDGCFYCWGKYHKKK